MSFIKSDILFHLHLNIKVNVHMHGAYICVCKFSTGETGKWSCSDIMTSETSKSYGLQQMDYIIFERMKYQLILNDYQYEL